MQIVLLVISVDKLLKCYSIYIWVKITFWLKFLGLKVIVLRVFVYICNTYADFSSASFNNLVHLAFLHSGFSY